MLHMCLLLVVTPFPGEGNQVEVVVIINLHSQSVFKFGTQYQSKQMNGDSM